jgi:type I restriction enzyme S subunit
MNADSSTVWSQRTLRSVCVQTEIWNPSRGQRDSFSYIDVSAVSNESFSIVSSTPTVANEAPSRARKMVKKGDVLFATVRPSLHRVAIVGEELDDQIVSTAFCVVRANPEKADSRFLYFKLLTSDFVQQVSEFERGASYPAVTDKDILDREILLPPLAEQRRIAAVLRKLQRAVELEAAQERATRELKQSVMDQVFARGLHNETLRDTPLSPLPESWEHRLLGPLAEIISKGASPKWQGFHYTSNGVRFVRSQNVGDGEMDWTEEAFLPEAWNEKERRSILKNGDVLINLVGASIGRAAVGDERVERANCNQAVGFIRLRPGVLEPRFLCGFLLTADGQRQIHRQKKDIARANLSLEDLRGFVVPIPPLDEQKEIAAILSAIDRKIALHAARRSIRQELFRSTLHALMIARVRVPADCAVSV